MIVGLLAAVSDDGIIATDAGDLPWQMRSDLTHFRQTTSGCALIVGRQTFDGLPRQMFERGDRLFLVLSNSPAETCRFSAAGADGRYSLDNVTVLKTVDQALYCAVRKGRRKVWCIGGPQTWNTVMPYASQAVVSRIHVTLNKGTEWRAPDMGVVGLPDALATPENPGLTAAGFHAASVEHRERKDGDQYDWSIERWRRGR